MSKWANSAHMGWLTTSRVENWWAQPGTFWWARNFTTWLNPPRVG